MIEWIFKNLGVVIFAVIVISQLVRGAMRARRTEEDRPAAPVDYDEQRRIRETQEQIRRQIAERRGQRTPPPEAPPPLARETARPAPSPEATQLPELFGGPLGRMLEEMQKRAQPQPAEAPPPLAPATAPVHASMAELERQARLAEELQSLQEARADARRRAERLAEGKRAVAESAPVLRGAARAHLLVDLAEPASLRRAMVLREVLGPPVALR